MSLTALLALGGLWWMWYENEQRYVPLAPASMPPVSAPVAASVPPPAVSAISPGHNAAAMAQAVRAADENANQELEELADSMQALSQAQEALAPMLMGGGTDGLLELFMGMGNHPPPTADAQSV